MEDVKAKLRGLFQRKKTFRGTGHVLGTAPPPSSSTAPGRCNQPTSRGPPPRSPASAPRPAVVTSSRLGAERQEVSPEAAIVRSVPGLSRSTSAEDPECSTTAGASTEELELAVATYLSEAPSAAAKGTVHKVLQNAARFPDDSKYRRIRLLNPRIKEAVVDVPGGVDVLQACGFELVFEGPTADSKAEEAFAVLPIGKNTALLWSAARLLVPEAQQEGPACVAPDNTCPVAHDFSKDQSHRGDPRPRNTQVLLLTETDPQVAAWLFERTPTELKAAYVRAQKRREQDSWSTQMLMTRATREKMKGQAPSRSHGQATIRVRLPEGLVLQGEFNAGESVAAVFEWLTECLRDPETAYELIRPDRVCLHVGMGSIAKADLAPSTLLNLKLLSNPTAKYMSLREDLVQTAKPA